MRLLWWLSHLGQRPCSEGFGFSCEHFFLSFLVFARKLCDGVGCVLNLIVVAQKTINTSLLF